VTIPFRGRWGAHDIIHIMRNIFFLTVLVTLFACSAAPAQQNDTAARVGSRTITTQELDDRWRADDPAAQAEATQKLYDGRRAALDAIVAEMLLTEAAKKKGMTAAAYELEELGKRMKPVTDSEVVAFYQANLNQMQGRALDVMAPAINRYLTEQQRAAARQSLITELRKAGPDVRVLIDAPRREVAIESTDPALGRASAPVTLIEFSDFQCPFCQRVAPTLKKIRDTYGDKVRIVWKDFPLTQIHPQAFKASEAAHCAGDQGKYWEYHDRLFANQQQLQPDDLKKHAADLGLDAAAFNACLDNSKHGERVRDGVAQGTRVGVSSTPTVYINGRMLSGAQPYETFASVIDEELSRTK
jgi:protein-disulfide isomerase